MSYVEVTVVFDRELDLKTVKSLLAGATVLDLKEELANEDPTGIAKAEDFLLAAATSPTVPLPDSQVLGGALGELVLCVQAEAEPTLAKDEPAADDDARPCEYYVMQGDLFKKPGADPTRDKVVRLTRKLGSVVRSTGRTWRGPKGGEWMQLDTTSGAEKPGWLLVEGPGFAGPVPGPLLELVVPGEAPPFILRAARPVVVAGMDNSNVEFKEFLVRPSTLVRHAKGIIAALFDVDRKGIIMSKPKDRSNEQTAGNIDTTTANDLLMDDACMGEAGFSNGDDVPFIYMGKLE